MNTRLQEGSLSKQGESNGKEVFTDVMARHPVGVAIVTAIGSDGVPRGLAVTSFLSVCAEPPWVAVSVSERSNTLPALLDAEGFTLNFLSEGGHAAATRFAAKGGDKFAGLRVSMPQILGAGPILVDHITAYLVCRRVSAERINTHTLLVGEATHGDVWPNRRPLTYWNRGYGCLGDLLPGDPVS